MCFRKASVYSFLAYPLLSIPSKWKAFILTYLIIQSIINILNLALEFHGLCSLIIFPKFIQSLIKVYCYNPYTDL